MYHQNKFCAARSPKRPWTLYDKWISRAKGMLDKVIDFNWFQWKYLPVPKFYQSYDHLNTLSVSFIDHWKGVFGSKGPLRFTSIVYLPLDSRNLCRGVWWCRFPTFSLLLASPTLTKLIALSCISASSGSFPSVSSFGLFLPSYPGSFIISNDPEHSKASLKSFTFWSPCLCFTSIAPMIGACLRQSDKQQRPSLPVTGCSSRTSSPAGLVETL